MQSLTNETALTEQDITDFYEALKLLREQQSVYSHPFWYNAAYDTICEMGRKILPLIYLNLREADENYGNTEKFYLSGHWHAALLRITGRQVGEKSVTKNRGFVKYSIDDIRSDWLDWLEKQEEVVSPVRDLV